MATKKALEGLRSLSAKEAEVIYYKCEGLTHEEIAGKLGKSVNVVHEQSSAAINKLGILTAGKSSDEILLSLTEYYEAFQEYEINPKEDFANKASWIVIVRKMVKDLGPVGEEEEEKETEEEKTKPLKPISTEEDGDENGDDNGNGNGTGGGNGNGGGWMGNLAY